MNNRLFFSAAAVLAMAACSEAPTTSSDPAVNTPENPSFITFGKPDGNAHPHVGTLLFRREGVNGFFSCTATLLSPTVLLTAGHCTESGGKVNTVTYVRFTEDALADRAAYPTTQAWLDAEWIEAEQAIPHPQFNDFRGFPNTYDVGVVILSEADAVELPLYGALPGLGLLERLSGQNKIFTAVGYGLQGLIKPFESDIFARYVGTTRLVEVKSTRNGDSHSAKFTNNPGLGGGTCNGDSGGPIFVGTSNVIGAVTSFGFTPCIGNDFNFRVDTELAQDFITPYLD
jgi:Trypsin